MSEIFKSIRLEGSVLFDSMLSAPWELNLERSNRPRFHLVLEGFTWIQSPSFSDPVCIKAGEAIFINDPSPHSLVDTLKRSSGQPVIDAVRKSVILSRCRLICGTFGFDEQMKHPLLDTLPLVTQFSMSQQHRSLWALVRVMTDELDDAQPGSTVVIDRMCELLLVYILRSYTAKNPDVPAFVAALSDRVVSRALQLLHQYPERNWTLDSLAPAAGLSRSALVERFRLLVGVPPMTYLRTWRMHTAKRLLDNPTTSITKVARQVGYTSDTAFNRAFKQFFNESPGAVRAKTSSRN
ncbi:MAG: AraC family transcriptional regulator [Candidatus Thiodiazotropha sp. (ex. Lucinoma kazani)]